LNATIISMIVFSLLYAIELEACPPFRQSIIRGAQLYACSGEVGAMLLQIPKRFDSFH
jgi:hypothetical protein